MRLFLAVDLPQGLKERIEKIMIDDFIGKRVERENLHVNLKFFGEVPKPDRIINTLQRINFKPFTAKINGFSAFPNEKFPRVIYLRVESPEMVELQKNVQQSLRNFDNRPYKPHVTLMRVRKQERRSNLFEQEFKDEFAVADYVLFKSSLTPGGPEYEKVYVFKASE
jgi:2'-5' RNA ligase